MLYRHTKISGRSTPPTPDQSRSQHSNHDLLEWNTAGASMPSTDHPAPAPRAQRQAPSAKRQAPSAQRAASSEQRAASSEQRAARITTDSSGSAAGPRLPSAQLPALWAEFSHPNKRVPSTEYRVPSTAKWRGRFFLCYGAGARQAPPAHATRQRPTEADPSTRDRATTLLSDRAT